jgi:hypothetical protein
MRPGQSGHKYIECPIGEHFHRINILVDISLKTWSDLKKPKETLGVSKR